MDNKQHEAADKLRVRIKHAKDDLGRVEGALSKGDDLAFSVNFSNTSGYFASFSMESMKVALILEKQRIEKLVSELEEEYTNL